MKIAVLAIVDRFLLFLFALQDKVSNKLAGRRAFDTLPIPSGWFTNVSTLDVNAIIRFEGDSRTELEGSWIKKVFCYTNRYLSTVNHVSQSQWS